MAPNGWIYASSERVTVALVVRDGRIADTPPYVRRWAQGRDARDVWRRLHANGYTLRWFPDPPR